MTDSNLIPTFSLKERDSRWHRVRQRMAAAKLDCLIGFPNQGRFEQLQANTRYLTQIGGYATEVAVVFPLEAEVTTFVQSANDVDFWSFVQNWIPDVRNARRLWSDPIIKRLKELKLPPRSRVGVIGLTGLIRAPEGVVPWFMFEKVKEAFPDLEFVSATEVVLESRAVKSAEEIAFIEKAEVIAETAVNEMFAIARAGVPENVLYAEMMRSMITNGGELPTMIYWISGEPELRHLVPTPRKLKAGDMISNEIEAKYAGYIAQINAPAIVGPVPDRLHRIYETATKLFEDLCPLVLPGKKMTDLGKEYVEIVKGLGFNPAPWPMHGRGLGDDLPVMQNPLAESDMVFEEGHVLIFKPGMIPRDGAADANERVGDTVVVTKTGARRLGKRPLAMTEIPL
ncbi:MAG TPA: M24 family metallopeptidase [Alphaproteobacteria bacterium]|jgi:Xaa-Pro aminopeptidase